MRLERRIYGKILHLCWCVLHRIRAANRRCTAQKTARWHSCTALALLHYALFFGVVWKSVRSIFCGYTIPDEYRFPIYDPYPTLLCVGRRVFHHLFVLVLFMSSITFESLGLSPQMLDALSKKGFTNPSPIQAQTIPLLLSGKRDIVGQAQTGTGKTGAFGIPLIEQIEAIGNTPKAIVLAPTRELALQVADEIQSFGGAKRIRVAAVYGGQSIMEQIRQLRRGLDIVVATPGRLIDHIERNTINLQTVQFVVLDEADEMLNMGFVDDIESILQHIPDERRMLLFSATMPDRILQLAKKYMGNYDLVSVKAAQLTTELTEQLYYEVKPTDKFEALCRVIDFYPEFYGLVFCNTKATVDEITENLLSKHYAAEALHGDISQHQRERILQKFKAKQLRILVATDVAARGIDVNNLTHVINYSLPHDPESYVHRIGRTGRAGKQGIAIALTSRADRRKIDFIQKITKTPIKKGTLPSVKDLISAKKTRIFTYLDELVQNDSHTNYLTIASDLLLQHSPENVIAALLKSAYQDDLDPKNYIHIEEEKADFKRQGNSLTAGGSGTRTSRRVKLNIELGRKDDFTFQRVNRLLEELRIKGIPSRDIQVYEKFSHIVCFEDEATRIAEAVEQRAPKQHRGSSRRPLVSIDKLRNK